ncbi:MAG: immunity 26/phosphotriesterase HocA family protein [Clostridia bacterium]|nr:immunity 26/phosphotriesterase HocA family protein [Clostridia bacterium]
MFELTNEQRKCFALTPVLESWRKIQIKAGGNDDFITYAFLDGKRIVKVIQVCDFAGKEMYYEYGVDLLLSDDCTKIMPKTSKGKPQILTVSSLTSKTPVGMALAFNRGKIVVVNNNTSQNYYRSDYESNEIKDLQAFADWVEMWCCHTGVEEMSEINEFSQRKKTHKKYQEGDFFRFKISRHLYGYGRILVDYAKMRKDGVPFWDIFMGKPLCVAVYHIVTEDKTLTPDQLVGYKMLPSQMIMDNIFYYGECEIIGNIPIAPDEDNYTVHYGRSIDIKHPNVFCYQNGKVFAQIASLLAIKADYSNNGIGWSLNIKLPILLKCIEEGSNVPYWDMMPQWKVDGDLRNPKFEDELKRIKERMGVN